MPTTQPLSKKEFETLQRRLGRLSPDRREAAQRLVLPMPSRSQAEEDPRLVQYAQIFFTNIFAFVCVAADEVGGRDCTSVVADYDRDRFLERVLREPTSGPPHVFGELVHNRLARYCALVLPGGLCRDMFAVAVEQEAHWKKRGSANPRLFVEPLSPWSEPELGLHGIAFRLGPEFVLERATRAVEAGIRGILCAPPDVEYLRPHFRAFPAEDPVRIMVDGAFDPSRAPPRGYPRVGSYEEAARFGADAIMVEADIWSHPDPMADLFAIIDQVAAGRVAYDNARKSR